MTTATATQELTPNHGRWLGTRGIFRHFQPTDDAAVEQSKRKRGEAIFHTMSTAVSGEFSGDVVGELIRWACDGEMGYEVRINGFDEHGGICDIAAYTIADLWHLAKVANDLRYEWEQITGRHNTGRHGVTWRVL